MSRRVHKVHLSRFALVALTLLFASCADDETTPLPAESLTVDAGPSRYALVGEEVTLDGVTATGAASFSWNFGNGEQWDAPRAEAVGTVTYEAPGRYTAVVSAFDRGGNKRTDSLVVTVTHPIVHRPTQSATLAVDGDELAVVSPDTSELTRMRWSDSGALSVLAREPTCATPRTVSPFRGFWVVACQDEPALLFLAREAGGPRFEVALPPASRPYGVVGAADEVVVTLNATGQIARVALDAGGAGATVTSVEDAIPDARGVAVLPDGRLAVTRWRSPDARGEIAILGGGAPELWTLGVDDQLSSDTESGGVPSYLDQVLVSPNGRDAVVPSLQANIIEGAFVSGKALTFQTTVRAVLSYLDVEAGAEALERRKQFDNRGFATAAVFTSRGDFVFVAMRGARAVDRLDMLTGGASGSLLDVGFAPSGLALSPDDRFLFVDAYLSREVVAFDVSDLSAPPAPVARERTVTSEPLTPTVLRGKQLFNDSFDPRLAKDAYVACAHCHLDGLDDHRTWDFTDRGEGLRNTITLEGRSGDGHGPIHWSGNFDEIQDFEHDIRGPFGGSGLMNDADFASGAAGETLGAPKAGLSPDLDALAAYVASLATFAPSPHRAMDGSLPEAAVRGKALFESPTVGCSGCHLGPRLTDSQFLTPAEPLLHDVGTLGPGSGQRLGGPLPGLDTPTLHGLWATAPYLHDGSAPALRDVLTTHNIGDTHGVTSTLTADELDDLLAYLLCLDGRTD